MAIKEFFRKLNFEINRRENTSKFAVEEFYFPDENDIEKDLEVGESHVSVTGKLWPES